MNIQEANKAIKDAWIAGIVTLIITLTLTLIYTSGGSLRNIDWWNFADLLLLPILSFGIYKKSRVAAVTMLVYYLAGKIFLWVNESAFIGLPIALFFAHFFWRGMQGTFAYHNAIMAHEPVR